MTIDRLRAAVRPFAMFALEARDVLERDAPALSFHRIEVVNGESVIESVVIPAADFIALLDAYMADDALMQQAVKAMQEPPKPEPKWKRLARRMGPFSLWSYIVGLVIGCL